MSVPSRGGHVGAECFFWLRAPTFFQNQNQNSPYAEANYARNFLPCFLLGGGVCGEQRSPSKSRSSLSVTLPVSAFEVIGTLRLNTQFGLKKLNKHCPNEQLPKRLKTHTTNPSLSPLLSNRLPGIGLRRWRNSWRAVSGLPVVRRRERSQRLPTTV